jgi:hypothetical protein
MGQTSPSPHHVPDIHTHTFPAVPPESTLNDTHPTIRKSPTVIVQIVWAGIDILPSIRTAGVPWQSWMVGVWATESVLEMVRVPMLMVFWVVVGPEGWWASTVAR